MELHEREQGQRFPPPIDNLVKIHYHYSVKTNQKYLFGHVFVTIAWIVKTPWKKALALPLLSQLYVKTKDVANNGNISFFAKCRL